MPSVLPFGHDLATASRIAYLPVYYSVGRQPHPHPSLVAVARGDATCVCHGDMGDHSTRADDADAVHDRFVRGLFSAVSVFDSAGANRAICDRCSVICT